MNDQQMAAVTIGIQATGLPKEFGHFNDMPPNWEEITESEFMWRFGQHQKVMHFRQVTLPTVKGHGNHEIDPEYKCFCDVYFWTFPDFSGVGFIQHYNGAATRSETDAYFAQWFKFHLCTHDFETVASRMCYWEGKCKKCGYVSIVDSSD